MTRILSDLKCPACTTRNVVINTADSFITDQYVDIPGKCTACKEEVRVLYDFTEITLD